MTYTAASQQGAIKTSWLHYGEFVHLMPCIYIQYDCTGFCATENYTLTVSHKSPIPLPKVCKHIFVKLICIFFDKVIQLYNVT